MIDRGHDLPITKQAEVLRISRGSIYYLPRPVPRLNPNARFDQAGGQILVANVESMALHDSRDTVQAAVLPLMRSSFCISTSGACMARRMGAKGSCPHVPDGAGFSLLPIVAG